MRQKDIAANIQRLRESKGLTVEALCELARVSAALVICLEHGLESAVTSDELERLSEVLGFEYRREELI